jgi:hypothetical protein
MGQKPHNLIDCTQVDVKEWLKETDICLVPIGSCEQHGNHLPLRTDSITAEVITERAAQKAGVPHTPLVWCGYSPQHMREPGTGAGTITLRSTTLQAVLYDIGRSLIHHGSQHMPNLTYTPRFSESQPNQGLEPTRWPARLRPSVRPPWKGAGRHETDSRRPPCGVALLDASRHSS